MSKIFDLEKAIERTDHFSESKLSNLIKHMMLDINWAEWPRLIYVLIDNAVNDDVVELFIKYVLVRNKELCDSNDGVHYNDLFNEFIYNFNRQIHGHEDFDRLSKQYPKSFKMLSEELYFTEPRVSHTTDILVRLLKHYNMKMNRPQIDNTIKQLKFLYKYNLESMKHDILTTIIDETVINIEDLVYLLDRCLKNKIPIKISTIDSIILHKECEVIGQNYINELYKFRAKLVLNNNGFSY